MPRWGLILLAVALLLGSAAAFTRTERLKLGSPPAGKPHFDRHFSPVCGCSKSEAHLSFLLRRPERLDAFIVDSDGDYVATLARDLARPAGRVDLKWDGKDSSGRVAPDGAYRLRIHLRHDRRTVIFPTATHLDTAPPLVRLLPLEQETVSPGAAGHTGMLEIRFRSSEPARAIVLVDGKPMLRKKLVRRRSASVLWDGTRHSKPVTPGVHELTVILVDHAGNRSDPSEPATVRVH